VIYQLKLTTGNFTDLFSPQRIFNICHWSMYTFGGNSRKIQRTIHIFYTFSTQLVQNQASRWIVNLALIRDVHPRCQACMLDLVHPISWWLRIFNPSRVKFCKPMDSQLRSCSWKPLLCCRKTHVGNDTLHCAVATTERCNISLGVCDAALSNGVTLLRCRMTHVAARKGNSSVYARA
jgi:hypothetical protein